MIHCTATRLHNFTGPSCADATILSPKYGNLFNTI